MNFIHWENDIKAADRLWLFGPNLVFVICDGRENQAFTIARIKFDRQWFSFPGFVDDNRFAGPGIHQLALVVTPRLNFDEVNTIGVLAG